MSVVASSFQHSAPVSLTSSAPASSLARAAAASAFSTEM
jgi:hypothetical protein